MKEVWEENHGCNKVEEFSQELVSHNANLIFVSDDKHLALLVFLECDWDPNSFYWSLQLQGLVSILNTIHAFGFLEATTLFLECMASLCHITYQLFPKSAIVLCHAPEWILMETFIKSSLFNYRTILSEGQYGMLNNCCEGLFLWEPHIHLLHSLSSLISQCRNSQKSQQRKQDCTETCNCCSLSGFLCRHTFLSHALQALNSLEP